ncbi:hypothetical protein D9M70_545890 [compost metagenome]
MERPDHLHHLCIELKGQATGRFPYAEAASLPEGFAFCRRDFGGAQPARFEMRKGVIQLPGAFKLEADAAQSRQRGLDQHEIVMVG